MNWPKLVVEYGQAAAWVAIFLSALAVLFVATRVNPQPGRLHCCCLCRL
jgi:hypothetical protein